MLTFKTSYFVAVLVVLMLAFLGNVLDASTSVAPILTAELMAVVSIAIGTVVYRWMWMRADPNIGPNRAGSALISGFLSAVLGAALAEIGMSSLAARNALGYPNADIAGDAIALVGTLFFNGVTGLIFGAGLGQDRDR